MIIVCTRFFIDSREPVFKPIEQAVKKSPLYDPFIISIGYPVKTEGEIFPTDIVPVIASNTNGRPSVHPMRWGVHMADGTPLFNSRSESAGAKPFFKEDWQRRRCIIPASYYFEWNHRKQKYAIQPAGSTIIWLCGIYRFEETFPYFTILTREPSADLRAIHDRMPLILPEDKIKEWIHPETDPGKMLSFALTDMVYDLAE